MYSDSCLCFSYCARKYDYISPYYQKSGCLKIWQRFILYLCCLVFSLLCSNTPISASSPSVEHLSIIPLLISLLIRYQDYLYFPIYRSTKFRAAFSYTSVKHFNSLPDSIKTSPSLRPSLSSFRSAASRFSIQTRLM